MANNRSVPAEPAFFLVTQGTGTGNRKLLNTWDQSQQIEYGGFLTNNNGSDAVQPSSASAVGQMLAVTWIPGSNQFRTRCANYVGTDWPADRVSWNVMTMPATAKIMLGNTRIDVGSNVGVQFRQFIYFNAPLTQTEIEKLEGWHAHAYNHASEISIAGHPYKTLPPYI